MNIEQNFCNYQISKDLKELGLDEECLAYYQNKIFCFGNNEMGKANSIGKNLTNSSWCGNNFMNKPESLFVSAPLLQQATQFLREKYNIHIEIRNPHQFYPNWQMKIYKIRDNGLALQQLDCLTYTEALIKAIEESIKLIKSK